MRYAAVAELADAQDLKSCGTNLPYRFDSGLRHWNTLDFSRVLFFCVVFRVAYTFKMWVCQSWHFFWFFFHRVSIYCFQYTVISPSTPLHYICIRNSYGMLDTCWVMPLRYNNDKRKKPLFSRGLSVCRHLFNSFSKLKCDEKIIEKRRLFH